MARARAIAAKHGAEVANSIPTSFNANPFMEITPVPGPSGELWTPTHGVLPFSAVLKHHAEFEALLAEYRDRMRQHRVLPVAAGIPAGMPRATEYVVAPEGAPAPGVAL